MAVPIATTTTPMMSSSSGPMFMVFLRATHTDGTDGTSIYDGCPSWVAGVGCTLAAPIIIVMSGNASRLVAPALVGAAVVAQAAVRHHCYTADGIVWEGAYDG
jgi:hypothetical protein